MNTREVREAAAAVEALHAISWCLRALACGWSLDHRERTAALTLLEAGIPGAPAADLAAATKILRSARRLGGRRREKASELSVRLQAKAAEYFANLERQQLPR